MPQSDMERTKYWIVETVASRAREMDVNVNDFEWFNVYNNNSWKLFVFVNGNKAILFEFSYQELEDAYENHDLRKEFDGLIVQALEKWRNIPRLF
ncbi:MAG: hypothetical protein ACLFQV_06245 [Vulcanimicrobiota bacterium]